MRAATTATSQSSTTVRLPQRDDREEAVRQFVLEQPCLLASKRGRDDELHACKGHMGTLSVLSGLPTPLPLCQAAIAWVHRHGVQGLMNHYGVSLDHATDALYDAFCLSLANTQPYREA